MRHIRKALNGMDESEVKKYITFKNVKDAEIVPPEVTFKLQSDPIGMVGVNGCQASDMLEFIKCLFESLNKAVPNRETSITITKLDEAIMWQDKRTKDRIKRNVEGTMDK